MSFQQGVRNLKFNGQLKYCDNVADITVKCQQLQDIASRTRPLICGFDLEWPVLFDGKEAKTALMQICMSENECFLFYIYNLASLPHALLSFLRHPNVRLAGIKIQHDIQKLARDFNVDLSSVNVIDLNELAKKKLGSNKEWGLKSIVETLFNMTLDKDLSVRASDWAGPLSQKQLAYAATDAYASWLCYNKLM